MENQNRGWIVTWCAVGINLMCGMLYSWSVFAAALVKDLGFTKTEASIPFTIALGMLAIMVIPGGKMQDRYGPRVCTSIGGVLAGGGLIIAGFTDSLIMFALAFGVITGSGIGLGYGATTPAAVKWFPPQKRGLISGLVVGGVGLASVYVAPMTQYFINNYGVKKAFWIEGLIFLTIIMILAQFLSSPPAGYKPQGMPAPAPGSSSKPKREYSPGEMIATYQFWLIWVMYACGSLAGLMIIGHMAIIAKVQANIGWAFVFVAILAIFNAGGRIMGGFLSDKLGRTRALIAVFALQGINMMMFSSYTDSMLLTVGIALTGIGYGSLLSIFPALTFDYYGMKNGGVNYGVVFTSWGVAGVIGPVMAGRIVDLTKSYHAAYMVAAGLCAISIVLVLLMKPLKAETGSESLASEQKDVMGIDKLGQES
ncbi:MAG: OFA family MFS transporter [Deltaproteobacteria bacterium]|nr:OFA family MFS transporter [Deltaproteobacteria bacterium]